MKIFYVNMAKYILNEFKKIIVYFLIIVSSLSCVEEKAVRLNSEKSNIIYILADDLGYGDLSCYGQALFSTPNIDALTKEGLLFTQHYAGSTVCAPSRSTLMTGQHTGHTPIRGNKKLELPKSSYTVAELLKENGYATGGFGKWGLGSSGSEGAPLNQGFDTFFGFHDQMLAPHYYPDYLWDNDKVLNLAENEGLKKEKYAPTLIHQRALSFIDDQKNGPFFLYYPSIIPHAELFAPEEYMNRFIGKFNPEKTFNGADDGGVYKKGRYGSQENPHAVFVAMITLLDDQVVEIVQKVKDLGLEDNTIFIFSSDNGPHKEAGADPNYFDSNGILKGYKRDLFEGGTRVPRLTKWKGRIKEGSRANHISAFWDIMPTVADILNMKFKSETDGISFLPTLINTIDQQNHEYLYWEFHEKGGRQAIRKDHWKLVKYKVKETPEYFLFDLEVDASETKNLSEVNPEKLNELKQILENSRIESETFKF